MTLDLMDSRVSPTQWAMLPQAMRELLGTKEKFSWSVVGTNMSIQLHRKLPNSVQDITGQGQMLPEKCQKKARMNSVCFDFGNSDC